MNFPKRLINALCAGAVIQPAKILHAPFGKLWYLGRYFAKLTRFKAFVPDGMYIECQDKKNGRNSGRFA
jgi:hypothetical protein